jgi:hypothetical protein
MNQKVRATGIGSFGNMSKAKESSKSDGKEYLRNSFAAEQDVLQVKLNLSTTSITHDGVMGDVNEKHFIEFLLRHLPKRYAVDSAIVIDSNGDTSDQIDIVIYDNQYTPTLLGQHDHRFVPAEAVYAVIEVKPTINKAYLEYAGQKAASVRKLKRTSVPIKHAGGEYDPKAPIKIISGIVAMNVEWAEGFGGQAFHDNLKLLEDEASLDFGLALTGGTFDTFSDGITIGASNNTLAYFLFRLLEQLQSLGTVPAVDWNKYAEAMAQ